MNSSNDSRLRGIKHLVQCHCMLPQYRAKNPKNPVFHQFVVFSVIEEESDTVIPKFAACNNCGAAHKVFDITKSEIITGRDEVPTAMSVEDFALSIPEDLFDLLRSYNKEVADFEHAQFIMENSSWGDYIILTREELEDYIQGKMVKFMSEKHFKVESYTLKRIV